MNGLIKYFFIATIIFVALFMPTQTEAQTTKNWWIHQLGVCESGWRPNLKHLDSNDYYSYGALQFQMATWLSYGKPFGATKQNIYNADLQTQVTASMLDKGLSYNWKHCYAKVTKKYGAYPTEKTP